MLGGNGTGGQRTGFKAAPVVTIRSLLLLSFLFLFLPIRLFILNRHGRRRVRSRRALELSPSANTGEGADGAHSPNSHRTLPTP